MTEESKEEDIEFYKDQRTCRIAHMSGHDKVFENKALKKSKRDSLNFNNYTTHQHVKLSIRTLQLLMNQLLQNYTMK